MVKKTSDITASNQLKITLTTITKGQSWRRQIRGAYHLIYPWIVTDFPHIGDVNEWIDNAFKAHIHLTSQGPTDPPKSPALNFPLSKTKGNDEIEELSSVGKIRKGLTGASASVKDISKEQQRKV